MVQVSRAPLSPRNVRWEDSDTSGEIDIAGATAPLWLYLDDDFEGTEVTVLQKIDDEFVAVNLAAIAVTAGQVNPLAGLHGLNTIKLVSDAEDPETCTGKVIGSS